jgi:hypothetical protein
MRRTRSPGVGGCLEGNAYSAYDQNCPPVSNWIMTTSETIIMSFRSCINHSRLDQFRLEVSRQNSFAFLNSLEYVAIAVRVYATVSVIAVRVYATVSVIAVRVYATVSVIAVRVYATVSVIAVRVYATVSVIAVRVYAIAVMVSSIVYAVIHIRSSIFFFTSCL